VRHRRSLAIPAATALVVLSLPATALAHVTVAPDQVPAGAFTLLDVRVPNERGNASTTKVVVKMPPGIVSASYAPVAGWTTTIATAKLAQQLQTPDGPIDEAVSTITWSATRGGGGAIEPGQFRDFPISVQIPGKAGDVLSFKALQTYSNGEIVRWIGAPDADEPAATVTVTAADGSGGAAAASGAATPAPATPAASSGDDDGSSDGLAIAALVLGALGLAAGLAALVLGGRRRSAA
jgi:uncharacterized protein